jgi:hypothetical protein
MARKVGKAVRIVLFIALSTGFQLTAQQPAPQSPPASTDTSPAPAATPQPTSKGLAEFAREQRAQKEGTTPQTSPPATGQAPSPSVPAAPQKSLGEIANRQKTARHAEVKINEEDLKRLATEIEDILAFAAKDTELPRQTAVKYRLVSEDEVKKYMETALSSSEEMQRMARSEVVLKKFGYLPQDFSLKKYVVEASATGLGGYYEPKTKTMNLVNWVGLEEQRPIMAHELTHALQDQNYDLGKWEHRLRQAAGMQVAADESMESDALRAVVEGQAMIVYFDYLLKPYGRTLGDTPNAMEFLKGGLTSTYDTSLVVRNAPLLFRETTLFPYREGFIFEMELLQKGGNNQAFAGAFARPPSSTHEILEPKAYLEGERTPRVVIPDLGGVLSKEFETYDSGTMGQLDVRILSQQLGSENDMFTVTPNWQGGAYVAVKRKPASASAGSAPAAISTSDISLLYVSRWKTATAAERFMEIYQKSLAKRVGVGDEKPWVPTACASGSSCASLHATRVSTNEGPVFLEILPNNTLFIAQGFGEVTANNLRQVVLAGSASHAAQSAGPELNMQLQGLASFRAFQEQVRREIRNSLAALILP